jgi:hypothetical protein
MRRALAILLGATLVLPLVGWNAHAAEPHHEHYQSRWVNAFWHSKVRIDSSTYLRVTWYAGAYDIGSEGFFSDLYRSVEKCRKQDGRDPCRSQRDRSWYGYTSREGQNSFTLDRKLTTGHLDATYKLYRYVDPDPVFIGRFHVVTDLVGTGVMTRGRESYTSHQGCTTFKYSGKYENRQATATGTLARGDGPATDLGSTADATFGATKTVEIDHTC